MTSFIEFGSIGEGYHFLNEISNNHCVEIIESSVISPGIFWVVIKNLNLEELNTFKVKYKSLNHLYFTNEDTSEILSALYGLCSNEITEDLFIIESNSPFELIKASFKVLKLKGSQILDLRSSRGQGSKNCSYFSVNKTLVTEIDFDPNIKSTLISKPHENIKKYFKLNI